MGTRGILIFKDDYDYIGIYRHWDSYTDGVIDDLKGFFKWNTRLDCQYCGANYIYYVKNESRKYYEQENNKYGISSIQTGHGLINDVKNYNQGDLEYVHVINLLNETIEVYSYKIIDRFEGKGIKDQNIKLEQLTVFDNQGNLLREKKKYGKPMPYQKLFNVN